jgi:septum site-determining protein MinC
MKAKQKKIRVFDIVVDKEAKFFEFMDKNLLLVKDYLLLVEGEVTPKIKEFLETNGLCFVLSNGCNIKKIDSVETAKTTSTSEKSPALEPSKPQVIIQEQVVYQESPANKTKVINKPVRSGEVIEHDGDIVVFSRVNSGAKVISEGNISIFETIDGIVEANGEYLILNSIGKGYVVFNGDILDKDDFSDGKRKKVIKTTNGYKIEDL